MYHADEVRDFQQVPKGEPFKVSENELELGIGLIHRLTSEEFHPENYEDDYRIRLLAMLDEKSKGKEVTVAAPAPQRGGKVVDIMEALKRSMERIPAKKKPAAAAPTKKKNSRVLKVRRPTDRFIPFSPPLMRTEVPLPWRFKHPSGTIAFYS
jgi:DNA end-binding protein Ku